MSRHYLLDGYNIILQAPRLAELPLAEGRQRLVGWINAVRPQGSARNSVTVVFDGNGAHWGAMPSGEVRVIFSDGQSADDVIKGAVDGARDRKGCVVVSDDRGIILHARAQGALVMGVREFAADLFPQGRRRQATGRETAGKNIPLATAKKINDEFIKLWLT